MADSNYGIKLEPRDYRRESDNEKLLVIAAVLLPHFLATHRSQPATAYDKALDAARDFLAHADARAEREPP